MSMNMEEIVKRLQEPFPVKETENKVQATNGDKTKGLAVYYIDSRAIQSRLDETVGPLNWRNEYVKWGDSSQICGLSIFDETRDCWVTKYDGAENTDYEPVKGGLSDSFKRAAVMWGLGRYLYDIEGLWVEVEQRGKGTYIKNTETQKLRDHYNKAIGGLASGAGGPVSKVSSSQKAPSAAPTNPAINEETQQKKTQEPIQNKQPDSAVFDFKVRSAADAGNSTCLKLIGKDGKELTAYVKKDSPGIQSGTRLRNVEMDKKQKDNWTYYMLNKYEVAA